MSANASLDAWIVERRPARNSVDPLRPYLFFAEKERSRNGEIVQVNTNFLTNRECPWRCLMCDLWKNTLTESAPAGAIPAQIEYALARLPKEEVSSQKSEVRMTTSTAALAAKTSGAVFEARHVKLYNAGSFFDPRAILTC